MVLLVVAIASLAFQGTSLNEVQAIAAMVQALGSLGAIGIAIWVPLYVQDVRDRAEVNRAINALMVHLGMTMAVWRGLQTVLRTEQDLGKGPVVIMRQGIASAAAAGKAVPIGFIGPTALRCLGGAAGKLELLEHLINVAESRPDPIAALRAFPVDDVIGEMEDVQGDASALRPYKVMGAWMIWSPSDGAELAAEAKSRQARQ